jgi:DNA-binding NarL/FixJ family response regulator
LINTVIVDDQEIVREGLKMILSLHDEINIVGEAANGEDLLSLLKEAIPDVILMDIRMPIMDGIEATKKVKDNWPNVKVIILTTFQEDEYIFNGLKNGADGYVLKDSGSNAIIDSIHAACSGNILLNPIVTAKIMGALISIKESQPMHKKDLTVILTPREIEVAQQILLGKSNKSISKALFVTEGTVKNYISHILDKLELSSRTELLLYLQKSEFL